MDWFQLRMAKSDEDMIQLLDDADNQSSQSCQTELQSLSSPKTEFQEKRTHTWSTKPQPIQTEEDNLLQAACTIFYTIPKALEHYTDREYEGGFLQAIRDYKDQLRVKIRPEEWDLLSQQIVHQRLFHFYDQIIHDTILDNEVLDILISRCILRKEDREEIEHHPRQSDRNKCILDFLIQRPEDSYSVLLEVLKESSSCSKDLIDCMEGQLISNHKVVSKSKVKSSIIGFHSVRLQKNYHNLTQNLSNTECIIDLLISMGVLDPDDWSAIVSSEVQAKINRKLLDFIRSKQDYQCFLTALKEDHTNAKLASDLESTDVTPDELKLIQTGAIIPSLTNTPGFQTMVTLVSMVKTVQVSNTKPESHDTSLSADLYRLQSWYNKMLEMTLMDSHQYQQFVQTVRKILARLSEDDHPVDMIWNSGMKKQVRKVLNVLKEKKEQFDVKEKILKMETEQDEVIPKNIRDQIEKEIKEWENNDKMFVTTRASEYVLACVHDNSCLTLTGPSGVGKSFIARHTALVLQKEGYKILPVRKPDDIRDYYQPGKQTVFIVDDICGNFTANQQHIEIWQQLLPVIETIIADKCCKIIVSCRLQVYKDDKFNILVPFKSSECNLMSDELCLTSEEKCIMASTYIDSNLNDLERLSQNSEFFPLLCSLYDVEKHGGVKDFFKNPFMVYQNELNGLKRCGVEGKHKICSLALIVLLNNQLKDEWIKGIVTEKQRQILEDTCDACGLNRSTSKVELKEALLTLAGTFVYNQNGIHKTVHDKLFDFLAHYFGQKMIQCLIYHGDSDLIHERFVWRKSPEDKNSNIDFVIQIPEEYFELYLERFIKDWSTGNVRVTLMNNNLTVSEFRQQLLKHLQNLDKSLQVTLANKCDTVLPKDHHGSGTTPLIQTCFYGYTDMLQWMLHNDVNVDQCRNNGVTGLYMASQQGHTDVVMMLLERNPNVDLYQKDGCSSIYIASQNGHTDIVKLLLQRNPNIDLCRNDDCSPLYIASQNGHTDIVQLLLERNSNINLCRNDGCSPLYMASQNGHTDIVRLLLEWNPDIDLSDKDGCSPLNMASEQGHLEIVKLLLERNVKIDLCNNEGCSPLYMASQNGHTNIVKLLLERNPNIDLCRNDGCSPLCMASQNGQSDIVRLLLERNPDIDLCDKDGCSPLNMASEQGHLEIVKLLLERSIKIDLCNNEGCSPLYMASQNGHNKIVKLLLERNPNIDLCDNDGSSPLYIASQEGHTDIVMLLLERNPNVDLCNNNGCSPLNMASEQGHTEIVNLLLERNPNIDLCASNSWSPLSIASHNGQTEIVKVLLEKNPNIDLCDDDGCSPLTQASQEGHTEIVKLLLEKNTKTDLRNTECFSPLFMASQNGHTEIVKLLLEKNPFVDLCDNDGCSSLFIASQNGNTDVVKLLLEKNPIVDLCDDDGCSPLRQASQEGHTEIVRLLLTGNPNIDILDKDGCSPLYIASQNGHTDIVKLLLGRSPNIDICQYKGCSPLNIASKNGHTEIVKLLLERNPNVDLCDNNDCSSLRHACQKGHTEIVKLLLERNSDIDLYDKDGCSSLYIASLYGHTDIVKLLLERNPNIDLSNNYGCSPLYIASQDGHTEIVKLLLERNPNIDLCDNDGWSPLRQASQEGHTEIVKLLLEKNPKIYLCDNNGCSPLDIASQNEHTDTVKLLSEKNSKCCFM
ncbi:uncharacterized protein LOC134718119 [Mytilus trossulus]|uniref:uncharacterized protein LOC134718119 n=1 Tax=Mytilus trossulus TaxID=6551 RepID=UPI003007C1D4